MVNYNLLLDFFFCFVYAFVKIIRFVVGFEEFVVLITIVCMQPLEFISKQKNIVYPDEGAPWFYSQCPMTVTARFDTRLEVNSNVEKINTTKFETLKKELIENRSGYF